MNHQPLMVRKILPAPFEQKGARLGRLCRQQDHHWVEFGRQKWGKLLNRRCSPNPRERIESLLPNSHVLMRQQRLNLRNVLDAAVLRGQIRAPCQIRPRSGREASRDFVRSCCK